MADTSQVDDNLVGVHLDCVEDISTGETFKILYTKPDGSKGEVTGSRNGTFIDATLPAGLFDDQVGSWSFKTRVNWLDGRQFTGENLCHKVLPN